MACWVNALDAGTALCVFAFLAILTGGAPDAGGILGGSATAPGSDDRLLLLACLACVLVLVRAASYVALSYVQHRLAHTLGIQIAARLLRGHLALPYSVHLNRNSAQMTRKVFDAVQRLVNEVLIRIFQGISTRVAIARALYRVHEEGRVTDGGRIEGRRRQRQH